LGENHSIIDCVVVMIIHLGYRKRLLYNAFERIGRRKAANE